MSSPRRRSESPVSPPITGLDDCCPKCGQPWQRDIHFLLARLCHDCWTLGDLLCVFDSYELAQHCLRHWLSHPEIFDPLASSKSDLTFGNPDWSLCPPRDS